MNASLSLSCLSSQGTDRGVNKRAKSAISEYLA
jgi:hypothetical protein